MFLPDTSNKSHQHRQVALIHPRRHRLGHRWHAVVVDARADYVAVPSLTIGMEIERGRDELLLLLAKGSGILVVLVWYI